MVPSKCPSSSGMLFPALPLTGGILRSGHLCSLGLSFPLCTCKGQRGTESPLCSEAASILLKADHPCPSDPSVLGPLELAPGVGGCDFSLRKAESLPGPAQAQTVAKNRIACG